ncbi:MAG: sigma-E factor negative regulatory protein [Pseudomonadota bacterium]
MNDDTTLHAKDLTRLSSREQLSALMDDALPADETRFLLRRLQHDATLAECWQRWRLTGEVMRGLAPAQRLPADFATRVAASLHGDAPQPAQAPSRRTPAWLRWGGGAAMAASLAVAALVVRQPGGDAAAAPEPAAVIAATTNAAPAPKPQAPNAATPAAEAFAAAGALAAAARPARASRRNPQAAPAMRQATDTRPSDVAPLQVAATENLPLMAQPDIVTRPWPRAVLPQYASAGVAVGFGNQGSASYNPFQAQAQSMLATTPVESDVGDAQATAADTDVPPANP